MESVIVLEYNDDFRISLLDSRGRTPLETIAGEVEEFTHDTEMSFWIWDALEHFADTLRNQRSGPQPIRNEFGLLECPSFDSNRELPIRTMAPCGAWVWADGEPIPGPAYIDSEAGFGDEDNIPF